MSSNDVPTGIGLVKLHSYFRSSAAYRVRIALNLKNLSYEVVPVHLLREGGQQHTPGFISKNPAHMVPVLEDNSQMLTQSLAIIEYLEETHPNPALLPSNAVERALIRALALDIACDTHPLANLRVMQYLSAELKLDESVRTEWSTQWVMTGLGIVEKKLVARPGGSFCFGNTPSLADCCLIPQVFNARRLHCDLATLPNVSRIFEHCMQLPAFQRAAPERQIDAE
jgi:maleylacetoacetate isomerase